MREPTDQRDELDLLVAQVLLAAAVAVIIGPALVVAVPLAFTIDQRGWRRWPWFLWGAIVTAGVVALGGWGAYWATWAEVWRTIHRSTSLDPAALGLLDNDGHRQVQTPVEQNLEQKVLPRTVRLHAVCVEAELILPESVRRPQNVGHVARVDREDPETDVDAATVETRFLNDFGAALRIRSRESAEMVSYPAFAASECSSVASFS